MFKSWKLFFSFLLFLLFLFPSFFFFLPSLSQPSLVTSDSKSYPSVDKWTSQERKATLSVLQRNGVRWFFSIAFGLKKLKFKDGFLYFDKLAAAFQPEILKQKKIPLDVGFDYTKFPDEVQKQILQVYNPGKTTFVDGFIKVLMPKLNEYGNLFFESVKPSLKKMQILGLSKVAVSYQSNFSLISILSNINKSYKDFDAAKPDLQNFALLSFSPIPNNAKNILDKAINTAASPWLRTLQNANASDLTHLFVDEKRVLTVNKEQIDVSSLVNPKVQEASDLSLEQIKILKKLQPLGLSKLKAQVQAWFDPYLTFYKTSIQPTLTNFANTEIKKIKIKEKTYQVDLLLKESNLKLTGSQLPQFAKTQLLVLAKAKITPQTLENTLQDAKLEIYRLTIVDSLNALRDNNISQITINDKTYPLTELIKPVNKNKTVSLLSAPTKTELATLAKNTITKTQLDTALATILEAREAVAKKAKALQTQKKLEQKKLIIGLSVGGGVLFLSSLGGFLYWFFKIKK